jgi:hypothetical protein
VQFARVGDGVAAAADPELAEMFREWDQRMPLAVSQRAGIDPAPQDSQLD